VPFYRKSPTWTAPSHLLPRAATAQRNPNNSAALSTQKLSSPSWARWRAFSERARIFERGISDRGFLPDAPQHLGVLFYLQRSTAARSNA